MFVKATDIEAESIIEHDIAIIGAGAAGITLALELSKKKGLSIGLFEGGGMKFSNASHKLYEAENIGTVLDREDDYISRTRLRFFGGTTNHWHGWCIPLSEIDFEKRSWVPMSGWPFSKNDLDPYYERANSYVAIAPFHYPLSHLINGRRPELLRKSEVFETQMFHRSPPVNFGRKYRAPLEKKKNVRVYVDCAITKLQAKKDSEPLESLSALYDGKPVTIKAKHYIVAAGGIENPRMLLLSDDVRKAGLGNDNDLVGRYFMEHVQIAKIAQLFFSKPSLSNGLYRRHKDAKLRQWILGITVPTRRTLEQEQLLSNSFFYSEPQPINALAAPLRVLIPRLERSDFRMRGKVSKGLYFGNMECRAEQIPNPDSRVTLLGEKDSLGMRKAKLDWRLSQIDRDNIYRQLELLAREFGGQAEGRVRVLMNEGDPFEKKYTYGGAHHMGTTRMSDDPRKGVVDAHCRMHAVPNLSLAGSSVFPTVGFANPTYTIVAMAIRLADHLKELLKNGD